MFKIKNKKIQLLFLNSFLLFCFLLIPSFVYSASDNFSTVKFTPQIEFPGTGISGETALSEESGNDDTITSNLLNTYISAIYQYGLSVAGILAAIMLMAAGVIWLTSGGDSSKVGQAKELIMGSIAGMFLLFSAYIILNTINPALVELQPLNIAAISEQDGIVCCNFEKGQQIIPVKYEDNVAYYFGGENNGEKFLGCETVFPDSQQCLENSTCVKTSLTSYSTINTGLKKYTGDNKEIYICSNYETSNIVGNTETESTITCCNHDSGSITYDVIYKNDKIYYNSGDKMGLEFNGCEINSVECPENKCKIGPQYAGQGNTSYYMCNVLEQNYCCSCYILHIFSANTITNCTTTSSWLDCQAYCNKMGAEADETYKYDALPDYTYSCNAENKCEYDY